MRKIFLFLAVFFFANNALASDVGFGISQGHSTIPRTMLQTLMSTRSIPPTHGEFVEISFLTYDRKHRPNWIFSLGNGVFDWDNIPALKGSQFDVSGHGTLTALTVQKQVNIYTQPRYDLHFRSGVGAGKLTTDLDNASLVRLLRAKSQSGYVPMALMSGGAAYYPNAQVAFGLDTGWGYLWEEYNLSIMCRF